MLADDDNNYEGKKKSQIIQITVCIILSHLWVVWGSVKRCYENVHDNSQHGRLVGSLYYCLINCVILIIKTIIITICEDGANEILILV